MFPSPGETAQYLDGGAWQTQRGGGRRATGSKLNKSSHLFQSVPRHAARASIRTLAHTHTGTHFCKSSLQPHHTTPHTNTTHHTSTTHQHSTVQHSTAQHSTAQHSTTPLSPHHTKPHTNTTHHNAFQQARCARARSRGRETDVQQRPPWQLPHVRLHHGADHVATRGQFNRGDIGVPEVVGEGEGAQHAPHPPPVQTHLGQAGAGQQVRGACPRPATLTLPRMSAGKVRRGGPGPRGLPRGPHERGSAGAGASAQHATEPYTGGGAQGGGWWRWQHSCGQCAGWGGEPRGGAEV